jgi:hypothetical protein
VRDHFAPLREAEREVVRPAGNPEAMDCAAPIHQLTRIDQFLTVEFPNQAPDVRHLSIINCGNPRFVLELIPFASLASP